MLLFKQIVHAKVTVYYVLLGKKEKQLISKSFKKVSWESMRSETRDSQIVKSFIYVCVYVNGDLGVLLVI